MVEYLNAFAKRRGINVRYNTQVFSIGYASDADPLDDRQYRFTVALKSSGETSQLACRAVVVATGRSIPNVPKEMGGIERAVSRRGVNSTTTPCIR